MNKENKHKILEEELIKEVTEEDSIIFFRFLVGVAVIILAMGMAVFLVFLAIHYFPIK